MDHKEHILRRMQEDIRLRGLAHTTLKYYTSQARIFLEFCNRPAHQLDTEDIRRFLLYLVKEKKATPRTVNSYNAAIRFLFAVTLNRTINYLQIPRQKVPKTLPNILSRDEVLSLFEHCRNMKHKALLMATYSAGLRASETVRLRTQHIDSNNMRILVKAGKGNKDRYTLLSETCLRILREYWKVYRPKHPEGWLFPGANGMSHMTRQGAVKAFKLAKKQAGIEKHLSIHSLRHSFATHLLEDGVTLLEIKQLLGHSSIQTTTIYLRLANVSVGTKSPLDNMSSNQRSEGAPND